MAKNLKASGFNDLNPEKQRLLNEIKQIIENNYKKHGFINIETPAIEQNQVLTAKGGDEVAKQIFGLYGLAQGAEDLKDYSLHFDLTVPLARYVIEYEDDIKFPFKRYQAQKVWRGERPQKGRFREFYQCDIDTIGENLSYYYDVEIIETLYNSMIGILNFIKVKNKTIVHINNRYFIEAMIEKYDIKQDKEFFKLLDNFYKLESSKFELLLKKIAGDNTNDILEILKKSLNEILEIFSDSKYLENIESLNNIYNTLKNRGVNVIFDPYITRGLDYYTGVVFETFIENNLDFGSVCSGGRYDNLVESLRNVTDSKGKDFEGVGGSIGLSRLFTLLDNADMLNKSIPLTDIIIFNMGESDDYREKIISELKQTNKSFDIYYNKAKLDKQFKYAQSKNIEYGIFAGETEEKENKITIKNLIQRTEKTIILEDLKKYFK